MLSRRLLRIKVAQAIYSHIKSNETQIARTRKEMLHSAQKCFELYLLLIDMVTLVHKYAEKRIEMGKAKHLPSDVERNPNTRFIENPVLLNLKHSVNLEEAMCARSWGPDSQPVVKNIYNELINSEQFNQYMTSEKVTFNDHKKIVVTILELIEDNEIVEAALEDTSIFWLDNIEYALSFAISTINSIKAKDKDVENILEPFKNDDDREFAIKLLEKSLLKSQETTLIIEKFTDNWELDRIAFMDKVLLMQAMTELMEFEQIPVKASLFEYIEISKYYSTPQSNTFINGVLDKAVKELTKQGKINKIGRGLI